MEAAADGSGFQGAFPLRQRLSSCRRAPVLSSRTQALLNSAGCWVFPQLRNGADNDQSYFELLFENLHSVFLGPRCWEDSKLVTKVLI